MYVIDAFIYTESGLISELQHCKQNYFQVKIGSKGLLVFLHEDRNFGNGQNTQIYY